LLQHCLFRCCVILQQLHHLRVLAAHLGLQACRCGSHVSAHFHAA
jgi:hypothetical protein